MPRSCCEADASRSGRRPTRCRARASCWCGRVSTAVCASDIHYMDHPDPSDTSGMFVWDADRDVVMGHEFVGEVVGHGPGGSDQFPVGTRVTSIPTLVRDGGMQVIGQHPDAPGSFGELFLVTELLARAVPDDADLDAVALTDAFAVGEGYVAMSGIAPGQIPLVIGAGAIGLSAVAALAPAASIRSSSPTSTTSDSALARALRRAHHRQPLDAVAVRRVGRAPRPSAASTAPPVIFECVGAAGSAAADRRRRARWARRSTPPAAGTPATR